MKGAEVRYSISCEEFKKRGINELMHRFETRAELKAWLAYMRMENNVTACQQAAKQRNSLR